MSLSIVKLGGSAAASPDLTRWIEAIAQARQPVVLVPGGGPFADAVRNLQSTLQYSDRAAHAMALLAMEQFGHVLLDGNGRFARARSEHDIRQTIEGGKIPVWFPSTMVLEEQAIPQSWDVTSDSLAAWLAELLDAPRLLLVKQSDDFSEHEDCSTLAARGLVDKAFSTFLSHNAEVWFAGPRHAGDAASAFARGELPGVRVCATHPLRRTG